MHAISPGAQANVYYMHKAAEFCRTLKGDSPKVYRPMTGQKYYFCDIVMEIVHSQEQLSIERMNPDINDSSLHCMFHIDGQKCLIVGDGESGCQKTIMATYDSEYLNLDFYSLPHHGFNTRKDFVDYCNIKTVLVTARDKTPKRRDEENEYLKARAEEWLMWGDGTKVFAFPYTVGSYESLPNFEWKYHEGKKRPQQPNMD